MVWSPWAMVLLALVPVAHRLRSAASRRRPGGRLPVSVLLAADDAVVPGARHDQPDFRRRWCDGRGTLRMTKKPSVAKEEPRRAKRLRGIVIGSRLRVENAPRTIQPLQAVIVRQLANAFYNPEEGVATGFRDLLASGVDGAGRRGSSSEDHRGCSEPLRVLAAGVSVNVGPGPLMPVHKEPAGPGGALVVASPRVISGRPSRFLASGRRGCRSAKLSG